MYKHSDYLFEKVSPVRASHDYKESPKQFKHLDRNRSQSARGDVGLSSIGKT